MVFAKIRKLLAVGFVLLILIAITMPAKAATWGPYRVNQITVTDGDTFKAMFEVFEGVWVVRSVRVRGLDTPELKSKLACERDAAVQASVYLAKISAAAKKIDLSEIDQDKYAGRVDARVTLDGKDLAQLMISAGHGRAYNGGKREPWCT